MKMKKLVSAIAALAMSVSSFTAFAAEGDVTTNGTADFTSDTGNFVVASGDLDINADGWLAVGNGSGTMTVADDQLAGATDVVTVKLKVAYGKLSGKNFYYNIADSNGTTIVDWSFCPYSSGISSNVLGNGTDLPTNGEFYYGYNTPITGRAADLTFVFDFAKRTVTQTTINMQNGATSTHSNSIPEGVTNVKTLTVGSNYNNQDRRCWVDDISISTKEGPKGAVSYSVEYKVNGEGDAVYTTSGVGLAGDSITAAGVFTDASGNKYYVDAPQTFTIDADAANNVWTQPCRKANEYALTVNATGDVTKEISSQTMVEGEGYSYVFPMYIVESGVAYVATANSDPYYGGSISAASQDETVSVTYTKAYENVVLYDELDGSNGDNAAVRASNCSAYNNSAYTSADLEPGTYTVVVSTLYKGRGSTMTIGENTVYTPNEDRKNAWDVYTLTDVSVAEAAPLVWNAGGSNTYDPIDVVLVVKTGEYVAPSEPPIDTTDPPVDPSDPPVDPSEPPVDPSEPPVDPSEPPVDPSEPPVDPSEPPVVTPDPDSPYASGNLITNGDFTNGTTDWTNAADGGEYAGTISDNTEYIHGDGKALTNTASAGGGAASTMRRFVPVEAGKKYYLSFYVYNATGKDITGFGPMSAFVPVVNPEFGAFKNITFKDYVEYGGQNSWSAEPQSEVNQARVDLSYAPGMNHKEFTITIPEGAENLMLSMFAWTDAGTLYFSDFELYELKPEKTLPEVAVAEFGTYTSDLGNPAKAYTGTFTVDAEQNVAVSGVEWTVGEASATSTFDTVISSGTVVTGLVVTAADLTAIPEVIATAIAAE